MTTSTPKWSHKNFPNPPTLPTFPPSPDFKAHIPVPANTDVWRPKAAEDTFTAPWLYTTIPTRSFRRARVTVSAKWTTQFDQGGLLLALSPAAGENAETGYKVGTQTRWIKAGIEFFEGVPRVGVVATDRMSDWSLHPLPEAPQSQTQPATETAEAATVSATIEIEASEKGAVWIYVLDGESGQRTPLREVTWAFKGGEELLQIGIYAARPAKEGVKGEELVVELSGLSVDVGDGWA